MHQETAKRVSAVRLENVDIGQDLHQHDAALKSATSDADLVPQLIEWARSRRAAEFSLSWDQDRDPDGLLMVVCRVCPEALPNDDGRTHPPLAFRSRSVS